ncbi:uncharacterized protein DS421_4g117740 [Arachis hypogaea]|nr:uncharacterized protein DS421_4g117740 [Arachis hypogaea]
MCFIAFEFQLLERGCGEGGRTLFLGIFLPCLSLVLGGRTLSYRILRYLREGGKTLFHITFLPDYTSRRKLIRHSLTKLFFLEICNRETDPKVVDQIYVRFSRIIDT